MKIEDSKEQNVEEEEDMKDQVSDEPNLNEDSDLQEEHSASNVSAKDSLTEGSLVWAKQRVR